VEWHKSLYIHITTVILVIQKSLPKLPKAEVDEVKQMENLVRGFDPVTEFDSGKPNEQMEANGSKKQRSALASSEYSAKSSQSQPLHIKL
jgi:hypothetical protein